MAADRRPRVDERAIGTADLAMRERMRDRVRLHLLRSAQAKRRIADAGVEAIVAAAQLVVDCLAGGGKIMLCGNGGSAADCQHMAAELVSRLTADFQRPGLPAIALTTDSSLLTAHANDFGFEEVFERQVRALGKPGDLLIGISTSGGSSNVIRAVHAARELGLRTLVLTGLSGPLVAVADIALTVPSRDTQIIQEAHLAIEHAVVDLVERILFADDRDWVRADAA